MIPTIYDDILHTLKIAIFWFSADSFVKLQIMGEGAFFDFDADIDF